MIMTEAYPGSHLCYASLPTADYTVLVRIHKSCLNSLQLQNLCYGYVMPTSKTYLPDPKIVKKVQGLYDNYLTIFW
jgi:hypothetical protein